MCQIAIASTIYELANQLGDADMRKQIQAGAAKAVAITAEQLVAEQ